MCHKQKLQVLHVYFARLRLEGRGIFGVMSPRVYTGNNFNY